MNFELTTRDNRRIIASTGDVSTDVSEELTTVIREQIEAGHAILILDLSRSQIIDSSGISALVANVPLLKQKKGTMILSGCNPTISKVFQLVGFQKHFPMVATLEDALQLKV